MSIPKKGFSRSAQVIAETVSDGADPDYPTERPNPETGNQFLESRTLRMTIERITILFLTDFPSAFRTNILAAQELLR